MSLILSFYHMGAGFTSEGLSTNCYSSNQPYDSLTDCFDMKVHFFLLKIMNKKRSTASFNLRKWLEIVSVA